MSEKEIRRIRRRKRNIRNLKRGVSAVILAPGKMPRITGDFLAKSMKACEVASLVFVALLVLHMVAPLAVGTPLVVAAGVVFVGLMGVIALSDYQDKLDEYELFGFKI